MAEAVICIFVGIPACLVLMWAAWSLFFDEDIGCWRKERRDRWGWPWNRKKPAPKEPDTCACDKCGHVILRNTAQNVPIVTPGPWGPFASNGLFCMGCRRPYDRQDDFQYFREMPVTADGEPIGYVKAPVTPIPGKRK